jgi:hypothetical protein
MALAIELRSGGATFEQIGSALDPPVSRQRAHKIVQKGLEELATKCQEKAEHLRQIELIHLNRIRAQHMKSMYDPQSAAILLRVSERLSKLNGLDAPQRIEQTGKDGGPIETKAAGPDFSKLSTEELLELERLHKKAAGAEGS